MDTMTDRAMEGQAATRYQPEIDGLRAVAVLAVILTHLHVPGFTGGFLGVDVFFVISGMLIHGDLVARGARGTLSVPAFYGRRLRRTVPGLLAVAATCLAASLIWFLPGDCMQTARGLIAAGLFIPNILFLTQSGYFDQSAVMNPLLHTWSLGVEAQFYLLCPLLPSCLRGRSAAIRLTLMLGLAGASLLLAIVLAEANPAAAFYLMPTRLWEFLIGCILAERLWPPIKGRLAREGLAGLGLAGLLASLALFSSATPHPSWPTLVPCLATATLIHAIGSGDTRVGRLLRRRVPVFLGVISYSLYLWHWPLIVFAHEAEAPFTPIALGVGAAGLLAVATLSWAWIETPFRVPGWLRRRALPLFGAGMVGLAAGAMTVLGAQGLPGRWPADVAAIAAFGDFAATMPFREGTCFITSKESLGDFKPDLCLTPDPAAKNVLLIGDSHAAHLWSGLRDTWPALHVMQATASGCKPVLAPTGASRCTRLMTQVLNTFLPRHHVDTIVIAALWEDDDLAALRETIAYLKPLADQIDVIGPMPRYDQPVSTLLARERARPGPASIEAHRLASVPALDTRMAAAIGPSAHYVSVYRAMCPADQCLLFAAPNVPMQFDYHHLTKAGSDRLMGILRDTGALTF